MRLLSIAAALFTLSLPVLAAAEPQPSIYIPKMRQDFGRTFEQASYRYSFLVQNRGDADLRIESVKPGCGCTVAEFDSVVAPGQDGRIELVLDGARVHGKFSKTATVTTNDPQHPQLMLTIMGDEIPYVEVTPAPRVYLYGRYGEDVTKTVRVKSNEEDLDFKITELTSDVDDKITYRVEKAEDGQYDIHVSKNPTLPTQNSFGAITIHSNSEKSPETTVQVQVITKGEITVQPQTVNFGRLPFPEKGAAPEPMTKTVTLVKPTGHLEITSLEVDNENFAVDMEELVPGKRYKLNVTFTPPVLSEPRQREMGELTVITSDPKEPKVSVRLIARSR